MSEVLHVAIRTRFYRFLPFRVCKSGSFERDESVASTRASSVSQTRA